MQITDEMEQAALMAFYSNDWTRGVGSAAMRRALTAAFAAAPTLSPPPAGATVPVRVAVAFTEEGQIAAVDTIYFGQDETAWKALAQEGAVLRSCIATIHAPVPAVPEVTATIEGTAP